MWNDDFIQQFELTPDEPGWHEEETGFWDSAVRSFDYLRKTRLTNSSKPMEAEIFDRNIKLQGLIEAGEIDARPFYKQPEKVDAFSVGMEFYDFDRLSEYAKAQGHKVDTTEDIKARYRQDALKSKENFDEADSITGILAGGFAAEMTDPVMLGSTLLGIGAARNVGTAARLTLLASENAAVEGITIPDKRAYAKEIQQEYGAKEASLDVLMAAALPPALDTTARAVGKALKAIPFPHRSKKISDLADTLLDAPEDRTIQEHFSATERSIGSIENPKLRNAEEPPTAVKRNTDDADLSEPIFDDTELDRQFSMIDDQQARVELDEIQKGMNDMDIIEACLSGRL